MPFKIGITGGIGCGKSYVCDLFYKNHNIPSYNTDDHVKEDIIPREEVRKQIIAEFGGDSYLPSGRIDRKKFRQLLFTDSSKLDRMNRIITPILLKNLAEWVANKTDTYVLVECGPLFENGLDRFLDAVIVVICPMELRIERLKEKRKVSQVDIDNVMKSQWPEEEKIKKADFRLINNDRVDLEVNALDKKIRFFIETNRECFWRT